MADIELVIKMPESIWVAIQNGEYCGILDDRTYNAIKNGIALDKIKAEIEFEVDHRTNMLCAEDVFRIIDKYRNEVS